MNIENIVTKLEENNIKCNPTANCWGGYNINLTHRIKSYLIQVDEDGYSLLELNMANNKYKKNRYHRIDTFKEENIDKMIGYIKTRKSYQLN